MNNLIAYYREVWPWLGPYLRDRPLVLTRYPDGIEGKSFYQKNVSDLVPDWVETVPVKSDEDGDVRYMLCNETDTVRLLANLGSIDFHPWMSRRGSLEQPDYAVIDLDPKEAPFSDVIEIVVRHLGQNHLLKTMPGALRAKMHFANGGSLVAQVTQQRGQCILPPHHIRSWSIAQHSVIEAIFACHNRHARRHTKRTIRIG